mmetsp:Transcript_7167/g.15650  ORF Transcript_7167/g.15650 Transcript_7167/m.15650 type:complete len:95 (-) Transcript_7167:927-1211(-)
MTSEDQEQSHVTFGDLEGGNPTGAGADDVGAGTSINASGVALSVVSKQYDRGNKGFLDPYERKMRELDQSGKGHLDNTVVYDLVRESLEAQKKW